MGLVSDGGVHSGWEHIEALIELPRARAFRTSSCTRSRTAATRCRSRPRATSHELERWLRHAGRVGTVSGRYYAMDRDTRWERTKLAYDALVHAQGLRAARRATRRSRRAYERGETDEFIRPDRDRRLRRRSRDGDVRRSTSTSAPTARASSTRALAEPDFDEFDRAQAARVRRSRRMTQYREGWPYPVAFPPERARDDAGGGPRRTRASASSTSPRPRSTRTSPTSSTAAARRSGRGRSAASSTRPATSPPTTRSPR